MSKPHRVTEEMQHEVILVFGSSVARAYLDNPMTFYYWQPVHKFLRERYPDLFICDVYPDRWYDDPDHKSDMDLLREMHAWQRNLRDRSRQHDKSTD